MAKALITGSEGFVLNNCVRKTFLPLYILICFSIPLGSYFLNAQRQSPYGMVFFIFMLVHATLRVWETFFTSKEKDRLALEQDWTLVLVLFAYLLLFGVVVMEFYSVSRSINKYLSLAGFGLYFFTLRLRWLCMRILGKQWAIHAVGETRIEKRRLLKIGPYAIVRHPIYAATVLEQLSVIFVANAYYSMFYFCFVTVPAYYLRMRMEEVNNEKIFGNEYAFYKNEVNMFFPKLKLKLKEQ